MENSMLRPDLYTKAVLSAIAACLLWATIRDMIRPTPAFARTGTPTIQDVRLVEFNPKLLVHNALPIVVVACPEWSAGYKHCSNHDEAVEVSPGNPLPVSMGEARR